VALIIEEAFLLKSSAADLPTSFTSSLRQRFNLEPMFTQRIIEPAADDLIYPYMCFIVNLASHILSL